MQRLKMQQKIGECFKGFFTDMRGCAKEIKNDTSAKKKFILNNIIGLLVCLAFALVFALVADLKDGGMELYGKGVVALIVVCSILILLCNFFKSSLPLVMIITFYIFMGFALQVLIKLPADNPSVSDLILPVILGLIVALVAIPFINCLASNKSLAIIVLNVLSVIIYLLLAVTGRKGENGDTETVAWFSIGGASFQLTEIAKVLFLITIALMLSAKAPSSKRKVISMTIVFLIHTAGLFVVNEFGTLIIMFICYLIGCLTFLKQLKHLIISLLIIAMVAVIGLVAVNICYIAQYGKNAPKANIIHAFIYQTDEKEETTKESDAQTDKTDSQDTNDTQDSQEAEPVKDVNVLVKTGSKIYEKFYDRLGLMFTPRNFANSDASYQRAQADQAIEFSGIVGKEFGIFVPIIKTDFIFLYVLMKLGVIVAMLTVISLGALYILGAPSVLKKNQSAQGAIAFLLLNMMVVQSGMNVASALGIIPTVGVNFIFLSYGGTAALVNLTSLAYILYAQRDSKQIHNTPLTGNDSPSKRGEEENV